MILEHYSDKPLGKVHSVQQRDDPTQGIGKPRGLWVSVRGEDDWPWWCEAEQYRLKHLSTRHEVHLAKGHKVLVIDTPQKLEGFHGQYVFPWKLSDDYTGWLIDWKAVAKEWQGIIIAPYQWAYRLPLDRDGIRAQISDWYYGWDCASGCIWDASAIDRVALAEERVAVEA